jgi:heat shock transcription factor, other eukaryote
MYGFHKIPHLQQGVLKSDTETEFWNFAHANFHRGQPDLLCLIQRKKPLPQGADESSIDLPGGISFGGALPAAATAAGAIANSVGGTAAIQNGNTTLSAGQILDIHSIANGITAIKRHQSTISSELSELKRSNQLLWQDALASRGRQQKQQDTINRIVKFLAGVFGQHVNPGGTPGGSTPGVTVGQHGKEDSVDGTTGMGPGTKRRIMLMIEDAKRDGPKKSVIEELNEIPLDDPNMFDDTSKSFCQPITILFLIFACIGFPSVETPVSAASPSPSPSVGGSDNNGVADANPTSLSTTPGPDGASPIANSTSMQRPQQEQLARAFSPSRSPSLPMLEFDPRNVLNHLSPAQFQQLLASLASQNLLDPTTTGSTPPTSTVNPNATNSITESNLTPYHQPSFDFSNLGYPFIAPEALIPFGSHDPPSSSSTTTSANGSGAIGTTNLGDMNLTLLNTPSSQEQREHEERMAKQWENAEMMEDDVNGLHSRIHSLAQALGLDPVLLDNDLGGRTAGANNDDENDEDMDELQMGLQGHQPTTATATGTAEPLPSSTPTATTTLGPTPAIDFDFDSFFNNIASSSTDLDSAMDYTSTAFLDEVPTPASSSDQTASPVLSLKQDVASEVSGVGGSGSTFTSAAAGGGGPAKGTRKRKSEVAMDSDISGAALPATKTTAGSNKSKRRKDK